MKTSITPEMQKEVESIYTEYLKDFTFAIDQRKKFVNRTSFYFDINRQKDAITAVTEFIYIIDGNVSILSYLMSEILIKMNKQGLNNGQIRQCFDFLGGITNLISYKEELSILQDILYKKAELINAVENNV